MATTKVEVPHHKCVQIMAPSDAAFATIRQSNRIAWARADAEPALDEENYNSTGHMDQTNYSPTQPTYGLSISVSAGFGFADDDLFDSNTVSKLCVLRLRSTCLLSSLIFGCGAFVTPQV